MEKFLDHLFFTGEYIYRINHYIHDSRKAKMHVILEKQGKKRIIIKRVKARKYTEYGFGRDGLLSFLLELPEYLNG